MAWNPEKYNQFKTERFAPFKDLMACITVRPNMNVVDLGCGTGEMTRKLADGLPGATVLGIDSSADMLAEASSFETPHLHFEQKNIEELVKDDAKWDLIFSNAAIQWVENHQELFPSIIKTIKPGGQLAIQMPAQHHNILNRILADLAKEQPYNMALDGWIRTSPVLDIDVYAQILFENGSKEMTVYEKIYPLIVPGIEELFDWISGTTLIPYLEKLEGNIKAEFITELKKRIQKAFLQVPVLYPFKRIIIAATF